MDAFTAAEELEGSGESLNGASENNETGIKINCRYAVCNFSQLPRIFLAHIVILLLGNFHLIINNEFIL